jgi:hypothetical protein
MRGWIYVVDHKRHGVTDNKGIFKISGLSPGRYQLNIIQPVVRLHSQVIVDIQPDSRMNAEVTFGLEHRYYQSEPKVWIETR